MTDYEKIEQYLNNELPADERIAFELQMQADAALATEVTLYKNILSGLQNNATAKAGESALIKTLKSNTKKIPHQHAHTKIIPLHKTKGFLIAGAAIAASVLAFVLIFPLLTNPKNAQQLYAQYAVHDTISATMRGSIDTGAQQKIADSLFFIMQSAYNNKQYVLALPFLQAYSATHNEVEYKLATGICLLETNEYDKAISIFKSVANTENVLKYKANWYTALTYLKQNKTAQCKEALQQIPAEAYEYKNAQQLLKELK